MLLKLKGLLKLITVQCDMDILKGDSRILIVLCKNERGEKDRLTLEGTEFFQT